MNRYQMFFVQISTQPQECATNLPNMEDFVWKTINSQAKGMLS